MRGLGTIVAGAALCLAALAGDSPDALFQAIRNNDLAMLRSQLANGADANARGPRDLTPLIYAAEFGSADAVKLLLDSGADANARTASDFTALMAGANDPAKVRMLVAKGADVNARSKQGRTPLIMAASCSGCSSIVRFLIDKGADVKAVDLEGVSALQEAANYDDLDAVWLLLGKGADPRAQDKNRNTPLHALAAACDAEGVRLMLSKNAGVNSAAVAGTSLAQAAPNCGVDVIEPLIGAGAGVNVKDERGMTPLMLAVASDNQDSAVVQALLQAGANVSLKCDTGETALDWAMKYGNRAVIAELATAGAVQGAAFGEPKRTPTVARSARGAVEAGTALLQKSGAESVKRNGCASCQGQSLMVMATAAADRAGVQIDQPAAQGVMEMPAGFRERLMERMPAGGDAAPVVSSLLAMSASKYPADEITDTMALYVAAAQRRDGAWRAGQSRAPLVQGVIGRTALALRALQLYSWPAKKAEFQSRIARARDWLTGAGAWTSDDMAMQMLGLHWAGAGREQVEPLARALMGAQSADGGWAPNPNLASDAYATGESLWALQEAGFLKTTEPAYQRGIKFLLDTQNEDGSWFVPNRAPMGGLSHGGSAATAWAVMALAPAVEPAMQKATRKTR